MTTTQTPVAVSPEYLAWLDTLAQDAPEPVISISGHLFAIEVKGEPVVTSYDYDKLALAIAGQWDRRNTHAPDDNFPLPEGPLVLALNEPQWIGPDLEF